MRHPFLRSAGSELKDPNFKNVTLLLHGDGTNGGQNNTFVDGSTNNFTITRNGNTMQGTFSPYGDNWSNYFDGTGDYLTVPDNAAFDFGTGDFTIELWVYIAGNSALNNNSTRDVTVFGSFPTSIVGSLTNSWGFNITGSGTTTGVGLNFSNWQSGSNSVVSATVTVPQNSWNHIAVARSGTTTKLFLNGAEVGSGTLSNQTVNSGQNLAVGRLGYPGYIQELNGYISNLRVLKGTAQYTGSYTIPTAPLTAITNTSLLTCQSNRFRDASTNNFTITRNGDVSVQRFSPFSPTAAYAAGTIGGSGYFDGTGDNLKVTSSLLQLGTSDFTLEFWAYFSSFGSSDIDFFRHDTGSQSVGIGVYNYGTDLRVIYFPTGATVVNFGAKTQIGLNQWTHVAITRSGNNFRCFLNGGISSTGVQVSSYNLTLTTTNTFRIMEGSGVVYISNYRLIIGTALYTSNFTPPTAPLTAITNTSLLLNFTNAAILDNAMMSVLETVGNAQIDTTIKKFGTGSLKFDGTGDYLTLPLSENYRLGTGDFTIEMWVYFNVLTGYQCLIDLRNGTGTAIGPVLYTNIASPTILRFYTAGADRISTSALSTGLWYHVALTRSGTSTKLFVNGNQQGSTYTDSNNYIINSPRISVFSNDPNTGFINGYVDDLRVTKGVARYTANFTAPTAPFPNL